MKGCCLIMFVWLALFAALAIASDTRIKLAIVALSYTIRRREEGGA